MTAHVRRAADWPAHSESATGGPARPARAPPDPQVELRGRSDGARTEFQKTVGSLAWSIVVGGFKPTMWDYIGWVVCLGGAAIMVVAPIITSPADSAAE